MNRDFGPVLFTQEKIDPESGLQHGSVIEIFSSVLEPGVFNLLHMHIEDTSSSAAIDVVTLAEGESVNDHKVLGSDSMGRPLRYKVLIKANRVCAVLYNTGSKVEQVRFREEQFMSGEQIYLEETQTYGKIVTLPVSLMSSFDKACPHKNYPAPVGKAEEIQSGTTGVRPGRDLPEALFRGPPRLRGHRNHWGERYRERKWLLRVGANMHLQGLRCESHKGRN